MFICVQKSEGEQTRPVSPAHIRTLHMHTAHVTHTSIFYLNWFLTPCLLVAVWPNGLTQAPRSLWDCLLFATPSLSLEILFIICGEVYCLAILVFISPPALTDTQGDGGEAAFGFVL